uniref:Putative evasin n=1 Tax=Rhipicephalus microplus TaxID=6941 RepID=A0A6G5A7F8_RHIMP
MMPRISAVIIVFFLVAVFIMTESRRTLSSRGSAGKVECHKRSCRQRRNKLPHGCPIDCICTTDRTNIFPKEVSAFQQLNVSSRP